DCSFINNVAGENGGAVEAYFDTNNPDIRVILKLTFNRCRFIRNHALQGTYGWGGGAHFQDFEAVFNDCYFINNTAKSGGGLFLSAGTVSIDGGVIKGNRSIGGSGVGIISDQDLLDDYLTGLLTSDNFVASYFDNTSIDSMFNISNGIGGGVACADTEATIENCILSDNVAEGVNGSGGAINFYGGYVKHLVKNCLLTGNSSAVDGGAISGNLFAQPEIINCTFSENRAQSMGSAVFCDWTSDATITDSIFRDCNKDAIAEEDFGNTTVNYSLFDKNSDGDYVLYETNSNQADISTGPELDDTNIQGDPLFVAGPIGKYYLSQRDSGQSANSPALNAGSGPAANLIPSDYTTRTDGEEDTGVIDIGFHYGDQTDIPTYTLTATVASGQGTIQPSSGTYYTGTVVKLTATPEAGWRVAKWSGTDNDSSKSSHNTVTIVGTDAFVEVEFWKPAMISVPGDYQTIQDAVTAANDGDQIVVDTGVYHGGYLQYSLLIDKAVYITSRDPHDPNTVASTIIRGNRGISNFNYIGVVFRSTTDANTVLNGFTIENFGGGWGDGDDGDRGIGHPNGEDGAPGQGAGIYIEPGASPVIKNCIIRNNIIFAGSGGNGEGADQNNNAGRGGWGGWARGAGIYCGPYTNPTLVNCIIEGNEAYGGNGGNGGDYASPGGYANYGGNYSREGTALDPEYDFPTTANIIAANLIEGHLWQLWEWDFGLSYGPIYGQPDLTTHIDDYRWYSAYGGGVFCDIGTNVTFDHCEIRANRTFGGMSGQGGIRSAAGRGRQLEPLVPYELPSYGAGIYCAADSTAIFNGCTYEDNVASETLVDPNHRLSPYIGYGG
ncbi:MAG TPA: hypothetical protein DIU00_00560, partial [Phycisphaerales bacterium]|nr:hypothetical protein [Phycisphaerales bacterium]